MSDYIEWATTDPRGYQVQLTGSRVQHIIAGHPEFLGRTDDLKSLIENPIYILQHNEYLEQQLYCGMFPGSLARYAVTVVHYDVADQGTVVTAWSTNDLPNRKIVWMPPINI